MTRVFIVGALSVLATACTSPGGDGLVTSSGSTGKGDVAAAEIARGTCDATTTVWHGVGYGEVCVEQVLPTSARVGDLDVEWRWSPSSGGPAVEILGLGYRGDQRTRDLAASQPPLRVSLDADGVGAEGPYFVRADDLSVSIRVELVDGGPSLVDCSGSERTTVCATVTVD